MIFRARRHALRRPLLAADAAPAVTPAGVFHARLTSILAVAPDDVWAAGGYETPDGRYESLLFRWNGTAWRALTFGEGELIGLARDSGGVVWVAGDEITPEAPFSSPFLVTHVQGRWSRAGTRFPLTGLAQASGAGSPLWGLAGNEIMEYR